VRKTLSPVSGSFPVELPYQWPSERNPSFWYESKQNGFLKRSESQEQIVKSGNGILFLKERMTAHVTGKIIIGSLPGR